MLHIFKRSMWPLFRSQNCIHVKSLKNQSPMTDIIAFKKMQKMIIPPSYVCISAKNIQLGNKLHKILASAKSKSKILSQWFKNSKVVPQISNEFTLFSDFGSLRTPHLRNWTPALISARHGVVFLKYVMQVLGKYTTLKNKKISQSLLTW